MAYKSEELIAQVRRAREEAAVSQRELSARSGLTQSHISHIERGNIEPGLSSLIDLARALDLEIVLVPKKLLPAVKGVIHGAKPSRPSLASPGQAAEVARFEKLVKKQRQLHGGSADLDIIADALHLLRHVPMGVGDLVQFRQLAQLLRSRETSGPSDDVLKKIAMALRNLRNHLAHTRPETPTPAYALEGDDDDA
jgi:transcriptional regulator with XRE-family HTH domain